VVVLACLEITGSAVVRQERLLTPFSFFPRTDPQPFFGS
jgi:hypothetical protein